MAAADGNVQATQLAEFFERLALRSVAAIQEQLRLRLPSSPPPTNPAQLAHSALETLARINGIRDLGNGGDGPSILTPHDHARLVGELATATRREKALVRLMTPFLCELRLAGAGEGAADPCAPVLVNSEESPWLVRPSAVGRPTLRQKPDLFRSWAPFIVCREGGAHQGAGPQYVFGKLAGYALQIAGCAAELYEAKASLTESDFGELCAYQQCVPGRCVGMLFDSTKFWLYETYDGHPVRLVKAAWTAAGSRECARSFFASAPEPPLATLLRELLRDLATPTLFHEGNCYLGSGAHGHVFRVGTDAAPRALKVALPSPAGDSHYLIEAEYAHMLAAAARGAPVVPPVKDSLRTSPRGGGGYLLQAVGRRFDVTSSDRCLDAFVALAALQ